MKRISFSSFRRYGALVLRVIWTIILGIALFWLYKNYLSSGEVLRGQNTKFSLMPLLATGIIVVLVVLSLYRLVAGLFGRVLIFEDLLRDKEVRVVTDTDDNGHTRETYYYYLYFEQIYGKYAKRMEVSERTYENSNINEKYYVGIINGKLSSRIYCVKSSELSDAAKHAVVTDVRSLGEKAHWRWRAPEEKKVKAHTGVKQITPEQIVEDMYAYEEEAGAKRRKYFPFIFTLIVAVIALTPVVMSLSKADSSLASFVPMTLALMAIYILMAFVVLLPILLIRWLSTNGIRNKKKLILAKHYRVVLEVVDATEDYDNGSLSFRDIHRLMPIRLASGRAINLSRGSFNDVKPGDKLYVVYLDSSNARDNNSIVAVYQEKLGKLDFGFDVEWAS